MSHQACGQVPEFVYSGCTAWTSIVTTVCLCSSYVVSRVITHTPLQILELIYLIYRAYYWLPVMLLSLTAAAAVSLIVTLRRQRLKVMALVNHCRLTPVVQAGWVRAVSSHTLVPGDVVVLQRGKAMCDMVLLQGACLLVESMLSGEVS